MKTGLFKKYKLAVRFMICGLLFLTSTAGAKPISGAFIQISSVMGMANYSQAAWTEEIRLMHDAGMDTVIVAPSIADGQAHYASSLPFVTEVADNGLIMILTACDAYNMKCYVGLVGDSRWWAPRTEAILVSLATNNNAAADELLPIVSQHSSFAGWYFMEEIDFNAFSGSDRTQLINTLLKPVVNHLKAITPDKPVAMAPYVSDLSTGAQACYDWWNYTLSQVDFDILMFQDGIGADSGRQPEEVVPYFRKFAEACSNNGVQFWNDLEVFNQTDWSTKPFSDTKVQIELNKEYVDKIVTFEWFYITPTQRMRGATRTTDRQNFYVKLFAHNRNYKLASLNKSYSSSMATEASYPDIKHELTDSQIDFTTDSQVGYLLSGIQDVSITIDLRENIKARYGFAATIMKLESLGATLPYSVKVYISNDNLAFSYLTQLKTFPAAGDSLNVYFDFPQNDVWARYIKFKITATNRLMCSELSVFRTAPTGDYNQDYKVDMQDINELAWKWLSSDSDGKLVNFDDFAALAGNWDWQRSAKEIYRNKFYNLRNVQLTQDSPYMQGRSTESIVSELSVNGVESVFIMPTGADGLKHGIVAALHEKGIGVGLMLFADSIYSSPSILPSGWEDWLMGFLNGSASQHISFIHPGYRQWMKQRAVNLCNTYGFDAVTFAEPMYPLYDGVTKNPVVYADVSPAYQAVFKADTGETHFPDFTNSASPYYFKTNTALYQKLVQHRIDSITNYFDEIINGEGGLRQMAPDTLVITWSLACSKLPNGGVQLLPEWEGNDAYSIVKKAKPDMHYYQTHWPDWCDPALSPEHVYQYIDNFKEAWRAMPDVAVGVQDDIGSIVTMRRSNQYYNDFLAACEASNVSNSTYYCFDTRGDIYEAAPQLKRVSRFIIDSNSSEEIAVLRGADMNEHADSSGNFRLRIYTNGSLAGHWLFISEIMVNGQRGGFSYTISPLTPPYSGRPDNTGNDLANGILAQPDFSDADWVEWAPNVQGTNPYVDITLHLQPNAEVNAINIYMGNYEGANVYLAEIIEVNGVQYNLKATKTLYLEFDQRIHTNSASLMCQRTIVNDSNVVYKVLRATVDGNLLKLQLDKPAELGERLSINIGGISDDPSVRWVGADLPVGNTNTIPSGTIAELAVE